MLNFVIKLVENYIEQLLETTKEKETDTSKNVDLIISEGYKEVLNLSIQVYSKCVEKNNISKKAKKIIAQMEVKMNNLFKNFEITSTEIKFDDIVTLAMAYFNLGHIYVNNNGNLNTAMDHLTRCMKLLEGNELHYKVILIAIGALNDLSRIRRNLQQFEHCYPLLDKALELYLHYTKEEDEYLDPFYFDDFIFDEIFKRNIKILLLKYHLETISLTEVLYYHQPANMHKFVIYIHNLLNKQLKTKNSTDIDMIIYWAETSADLITYFIFHDRFMEAKIHLAAADYMTAIFYTLIITDQDYSNSKNFNKYETVHIYIVQFRAIYDIILLCSSKERLLQYEGNKSCKVNKIESESHLKSEEELMKPLTFVDLEKSLQNIDKYYNKDTYLPNLDNVKIIFADILKRFDIVNKYYDKINLYMGQVQIVLYISKAYTYYAYFAGSKSKQMKVIKQQIQVLKRFISQLSSKYALEEYCYYKILYFELAIVYSTLLDIVYEEFDEMEEMTDEMRMEIKQLVENIIDSFNLFI